LAGSIFVEPAPTPCDPTFSVVIATFGRENQIIPTLESVANQSFRDFEVIVVSDGPYSSTLKNIVNRFGSSFSLHSLPSRTRSQSGPNNLGWEVAQGKYIAYLGHDDIWSSQHLANLAGAYKSNERLDFAVAGCIYFGPAGTDDKFTWVTGLFENSDLEAARKYFFPPSSFSHKRIFTKEIPRWSEPLSTRRPVDTEFLIGAFEKGCSFGSTGKISVFKFASALRYLSYLCPDDYEQRQIMQLMKNERFFEKYIEQKVDASIQNAGFMVMQHAPIDMFTPGQKVLENEIVRGIKLPKIAHLMGIQKINVGDDFRGFDWYAPEEVDDRIFRWTGPNNNPRMLIPFCYEGLVCIVFRVVTFASVDIRKSLKILLNGKEVKFQIVRKESHFVISFTSNLKRNEISTVEFQMNRTKRPVDDGSIKRRIFSVLFPSKSKVAPDSRRLGLCLESAELQPKESTA
jgi:glycosyltransferase involved in cell wall biosynthesis